MKMRHRLSPKVISMMAHYPDVFIMTFSIHIPNFALLSQSVQLCHCTILTLQNLPDAFQFTMPVFSLLNRLDIRKSLGPDSLSGRFLKEVAEQIVTPLTKIYNKSLESGVVPQDWKCSNVTPVHKGVIQVTFGLSWWLQNFGESCIISTGFLNESLSPYQGTEQLLLVASDIALDSGKSSCIAS